MDRAENCNHDNMPGTFENLKITEPEKGKFFLNTNLVVNRDFPGPLELHIEIIKCTIDGSNCYTIDKIVITKLCTIIHDKTAPWHSFTEKIVPHIQCPIKEVFFDLFV